MRGAKSNILFSILLVLSIFIFAHQVNALIKPGDATYPSCDLQYRCSDDSAAAIRATSCLSGEAQVGTCTLNNVDYQQCCPAPAYTYPECVDSYDCQSNENCANYNEYCTGGISKKVWADGTTGFSWTLGYTYDATTKVKFNCDQCSDKGRVAYRVYENPTGSYKWEKIKCEAGGIVCSSLSSFWFSAVNSYVAPAKSSCDDLSKTSCTNGCTWQTDYGECTDKCTSSETYSCSGSYLAPTTYRSCEGTYTECDQTGGTAVPALQSFLSFITGKVAAPTYDPDCSTTPINCFSSQCDSGIYGCHWATVSSMTYKSCSTLSEADCDAKPTCTKTCTTTDPIPTISISSPTAGTTTSSNSFSFTATTSSGTITSCNYSTYIKGPMTPITGVTSGVKKTVTGVSYVDGSNTLTISCYNSYGKAGLSFSTFTYSPSCADTMTWLTNPQTGDKSCDPTVSARNVFLTCNSDGSTTPTTCPTGQVCSDTNGLNAQCVNDAVGACQDCSINQPCQDGYSCETTLGGDKACVPTGSCATGVGGTSCSSTTSTCVGTTKYTCTTSTGSWDSGTANSAECGWTPDPNFLAYWGKTSTNQVFTVSEGTAVNRYFKDSNNIFSGTVTFSGDGTGATSATMTNGAVVSSTGFASATEGTYTFTGTTSAGSDQATLTVTKAVCGNSQVEGTEQCDLGINNKATCTPSYNTPCSFCSDGTSPYTACTSVTIPADGAPNNGVCDKPDETCADSDCISTADCAQCNDGTLQDGEACDVPQPACTPSYGSSCTYCSGTCDLVTVQGGTCSNGIQDGSEAGVDCGDTDGVCTGDKTTCVTPYVPATTCQDYNESYCASDPDGVATTSVGQYNPDTQTPECKWINGICQGNIVNSVDGVIIGSCAYIQNPTADTCEDGFLAYSWNGTFTWDDGNNYFPNATQPPCSEDYTLGTDNMCHYDPLDSWKSCTNGQRSIPCPAQIQLNYFTWKNLVAAVLLVIIIYLLVNNRKKKEKVKKEVEKMVAPKPKKKVASKKKPTTKKVTSKKKVTKKKSVSKR